MVIAVFKETWRHLIRHKKNRLVFVLALIGMVVYSGFLLPHQDDIHTIDLDKLEMSIHANKGIMETAAEKENFSVNLFTGRSAYVDGKLKYENSRALLNAIENGDVSRYLAISRQYVPDFHKDKQTEFYQKNSLFPDKDYLFDSMMYSKRLESYPAEDLSFHVVQEKTAWQQIQAFLSKWGPTVLVTLTLFIACDVFVLGIKKRTQQIGVPMAWGSYLFIQSFAIIAFILVMLSTLAASFFLINGILYGFGSLNWPVVLFNYSEDFFFSEVSPFTLVSIGSFLAQALPFLIVFIYFFTRLSAFWSLIFKQEVVVFLAGLFTLLFEKLYFSRTTRDLLGIDISYFPQTYFDFGKVMTGEKNYLLNTSTVTAGRGIVVVLVAVVCLELLLALAARLRTRQTFIG